MNNNSYSYDTFTLYNYGNKFKLVYNKVKRNSGVELERSDIVAPVIYKDDDIILKLCDTEPAFNISGEYRFYESLIRSKNSIFGYAMCNDWDFFATFTLNPKLHDRFDINSFYKKFTKFINNYNRKLDNNIKYLLVPERHKNGAWHMHGFLKNIPIDDLKKFQLSEKIPMYLKNKIKSGSDIFSWVSYSRKFGFNDLEFINDKTKASIYITKYITKDMLNIKNYPNKHLYYCSKGLNKPKKIDVCPLNDTPIEYGYSDDFCSIKWYDNVDDIKKDFVIDSIDFFDV